MVIGDISIQDETQKPYADKGFYPARVLDRILALVIDISLFFPLAGFVSFPLLKKYQELSLKAPSSTEFEMMILLVVCAYVIYWVVYQTVCIHFMSATIGQKALKMKWVSDREAHNHRVLWSQATGRSVFWLFQLVFFPWTMLEVMGHKRRQLIADRAFEMALVAPLMDSDSVPARMETQFFRHAVILISVLLGLIAQSLWISGYISVLRGDYQLAKLDEDNYLCKEVSQAFKKEDKFSVTRPEMVATLFLSNQINAQCVNAESDFLFWSLDEGDNKWASYLKSLVYQAEDQESQQEKYLSQACQDKEKDADVCRLVEITKGELQTVFNFSKLEKLVWYKSQEVEYGKPEYLNLVKEFLQSEWTQEYAQKEYVKHLWESQEKRSSYDLLVALKSSLKARELTQLKNWFCSHKADIGCKKKSVRDVASVEKSTEEPASAQEDASANQDWIELLRKNNKL